LSDDPDPLSEPLIDSVVRQLQGLEPIDEREAWSRAECLTQLGALAAPFDRHADPTHVTGSGIVIASRGVLLLLHRRLHIWVQPGGHLEGAESPWDAARRETMEETGLAVRLVGADPIPRLLHVDVHTAGPHVHLDLRYLLAVDGDDEPRPPPGESQDVRWMSWSEAVATADVGLSGLLRVLSPAP
jgi:8-oxo-dGTP pyrophosphatase MutT (NUDIX family)